MRVLVFRRVKTAHAKMILETCPIHIDLFSDDGTAIRYREENPKTKQPMGGLRDAFGPVDARNSLLGGRILVLPMILEGNRLSALREWREMRVNYRKDACVREDLMAHVFEDTTTAITKIRDMIKLQARYAGVDDAYLNEIKRTMQDLED